MMNGCFRGLIVGMTGVLLAGCSLIVDDKLAQTSKDAGVRQDSGVDAPIPPKDTLLPPFEIEVTISAPDAVVFPGDEVVVVVRALVPSPDEGQRKEPFAQEPFPELPTISLTLEGRESDFSHELVSSESFNLPNFERSFTWNKTPTLGPPVPGVYAVVAEVAIAGSVSSGEAPLVLCSREPSDQPDECPATSTTVCAPQNDKCKNPCLNLPATTGECICSKGDCSSTDSCVSFISVNPYPAIAGKPIDVEMSIGGHDLSAPDVHLQLDLLDLQGQEAVAWLYDGSKPSFRTQLMPAESGLYLLQAYLNAGEGTNEAMVAHACWPIVVKPASEEGP